MNKLSSHIESGIKTVIDGLNYDINIDYKIEDNDEYENYIGYNIVIITNKGITYKGVLEKIYKSHIQIQYTVKDSKNKLSTKTRKKVLLSTIDSARVFEEVLLQPDRMKQISQSKVSAFDSAKKMMIMWVNSPNAPSKSKIKKYIELIVNSGEKAISFLIKALEHDIDYDSIQSHKFHSAIDAKPFILESIYALESSIKDLKDKLLKDDISLEDKQFILGYAEKYAKGEFYGRHNYYKDWYDKEQDSIKICPFGTQGENIILDDLKITLPKKPRKKDILFSNLPKKQQYWRRLEVPNNINPSNKLSFDEYILEEFRRRREGVWFMNNGEPVYLTGDHYFALQWCKMLDTGGYMDFRYAQLNIYYHLQACCIDDRCLGQLFVKSRRTGFTYIVLTKMLNDSTGTRNNNFGMTSKTEEDAKKAFLKYRYMLLNLPFYFIPVIKGKLDSTKEFEFSAPLDSSTAAKKMKKGKEDDYLNNLVDYQPTKNDSYDGQALYMYLGDESGKWTKKNGDYIEHFGQISPTMLEGGVVVGKAFIGSTVGALSKGGEQFKQMYDASSVNERNEVTKMTSSGLYRYFLPAQENMTAFTDKYGKCHKTTPENTIYNVNGKLIKTGSIEYLMSQEKSKENDDKALNEQYRAFPRTIDHAFRDESSESVFNMTKLYQQIEFNDKFEEEKLYTIGNFEWINGRDGRVEFFPNPKGRFYVSWMPSVVDGTEHLANRVEEINDQYYPLNKDLVRFGCDPFSLKSTHGEGSKGGLHGLTITFPQGGAPSNSFVVEYIARPSDETIFYEDIIKCIRYYGSPILVESNRIDLLRYMFNRGYRGFAMNRLDRPFTKLNPNEKKYGGQVMSGKDILDSHMNSIGSWIEKYVGVSMNDQFRQSGEMGEMVFNRTLRDWLSFDPDNRTKYDATISSGLAIMACQTEKYKGKKKEKKKVNISNFVKRYNNKGNIGSLIN